MRSTRPGNKRGGDVKSLGSFKRLGGDWLTHPTCGERGDFDDFQVGCFGARQAFGLCNRERKRATVIQLHHNPLPLPCFITGLGFRSHHMGMRRSVIVRLDPNCILMTGPEKCRHKKKKLQPKRA